MSTSGGATGLLKGYQVDAERERLLASALERLSLVNSGRWINFMQKDLPETLLGEWSLLPSLTSLYLSGLCRFSKPLWFSIDQYCLEDEGAVAGVCDEEDG